MEGFVPGAAFGLNQGFYFPSFFFPPDFSSGWGRFNICLYACINKM